MSTEDRDRLRMQQIALAKALTQPGFGPSQREASLPSLDPEEIARSADTLIRKRLSQTRSALRGTAKLLGDEFARDFREFASNHFFSGPDAIWRDAIEFSRWLARRRQEPEWLHDVLRWECERCLWESQKFYLSFFRLRHRVAAWIDEINDKALSDPPQIANQWIFLWRLGGRTGAWTIPRRRLFESSTESDAQS